MARASSRSYRIVNKTHYAKSRLAFSELLAMEVPQTIQAIASALGYPPELVDSEDAKCLSFKIERNGSVVMPEASSFLVAGPS